MNKIIYSPRFQDSVYNSSATFHITLCTLIPGVTHGTVTAESLTGDSI